MGRLVISYIYRFINLESPFCDLSPGPCRRRNKAGEENSGNKYFSSIARGDIIFAAIYRYCLRGMVRFKIIKCSKPSATRQDDYRVC